VTITQSGETADTLAALKHARALGMAHTLTVCNVATSAMVRECALAFITRAGVEIGVASTKAFTTQLVGLFLLTLALANAAAISRYMRSSMLDNMGQDYVRTARAKGMAERTVVLKHVLRNSLIPVVTVIALGIPAIFGGAIITENLFGVNGIGSALILAIRASDLPTVQTLAFIFAVLIVLFNLIADILYGLLDPRIRYD